MTGTAASLPSGEESKIDSGSKKDKSFLGRKVNNADFVRALKEIPPAFGMDSGNLESRVRGGLYNYGPAFSDLYDKCKSFVAEIKHSKNTQLLSMLLEGERGCGKTALAAKLALEGEFPFVKMISPENFVGLSIQAKLT